MAAIVGLIGEGSLGEVRAMAERMPHRGAHVSAWSPSPGVFFCVRGGSDSHVLDHLAADAQLDEQSPTELAQVLERSVEGLAGVPGYFALAFWDEGRQSVVLACDTSGFKSLYYIQLKDRIAFASEYKALLALNEVRAELDLDSAQYYLATRSFRMNRPLLFGVQPLTAGRALVVRKGKASEFSYWTPTHRIEHRSRAYFKNEVRRTLEHVVRRQASRFARIGITLSGGLDSACVLALLRKTCPDLHISSYTIGFGPEDPETRGGRELAELFGCQHHEVAFDPESVRDRLPFLVWLMEDCAGREEALLQNLVLSEAARSETVVFGGYGADTLFAGMPRYRLMRMRDSLPWLRKSLSGVFQYTQTGTPPRTTLGKLGCYLLSGRDAWPPPQVIGATGPALVEDDLPLDQYIASQMNSAQDSGYIEPSLAAGGMEFRDPFQSTEMLELALRIPGGYNVGWHKQKMVLREAVADLMPRRVTRRGKSLQRVQHDRRMSDVIDELADQLLSSESIRNRGIVSIEYVGALRKRESLQPYTRERLYRLWTLVCLELWQRHFIDHRGRLAATPP